MVLFSGCEEVDSAECLEISFVPDIINGQIKIALFLQARDDIMIENIIINRGNCWYQHWNKISEFSKATGLNILVNGVDAPKLPNGEELSDKEINELEKHDQFKPLSLKFGENKAFYVFCNPLEVVFETNLGNCEYK